MNTPLKDVLARAEKALPSPIMKLIERTRDQEILLYAAALAFYALVSVAPLVIATLWVTSLFMRDSQIKEAADTFGSLAPKALGADKALQRVAEIGTRLGLPALIGALWPATAYGAGLTRAFDRLSPRREKRELKGLRGRGLALVVLLPLLVAGGLGGSYLGASVFDRGALRVAGYAVAAVGGFAGAAVACAAIYRIFPPETPTIRCVAKGAAVAAAGISLLSLVFTAYLNLGADFEEHYATSGLAGVVLLAVWLYLSNALLLAGYQVVIEAKG